MKKIVLLLVFLGITANSSAKELRVYLDWFYNIEFTGMFLALEKGWYQEKGIELKLVFKDLNIIERVINGEADVGMHSANELIKYTAKGHPLKAIAAKYQINPHCIVTGKDIQKLSDLKNKVIGILSPQEYELYTVMLNHVGLGLSDVTFKEIDTFNENELLGLLRSKTIDALMAWEFSWTLTFSLLGFETRVFPSYDYGFHYYGIVYFTTDRYLKQNRAVLKDFLEVTFRGWKEVFKNPEQAAKWVVEKWYPKDKYILESKELTQKQQILELKLRQKHFFEGVGRKHIGIMSEFNWQKSIDISRRIGMLPPSSSIRPKDLYDNSLVLEIINRAP
jgi:ABC-type nitrate/sulfonate/bicarbonate transport system substrate-binding protein